MTLGVLFVLAALAGAQSGSVDGAGDALAARRLAHLLAYVAADYPNAVADGKVLSPFEHEEQLTLLSTCRETALAAGLADMVAPIEELRERAAAVAPAEEVAAAARALRREVIRSAQLSLLPPHPPNLARGEALYRKNCASCHGLTGRADTQQARSLRPRPASFSDPVIGEALSPLVVADTLLFGIEGTAMVPFTFLSEEERWDAAFYVVALRHTPREWPETPRWSLEELAMRSDGDILDELYAAGMGLRELSSALADLRRTPGAAGTGAMAALWSARGALAHAEEELSFGHRDAAAALVERAHWQHIRAALPGVALWDPRLAAEIDERMFAFRHHLGGASDDDLERDLAVLFRVLSRAQVAVARAGSSAPPAVPTLAGVPRGDLPAPSFGKTFRQVALAAVRAGVWPAAALVALAAVALPGRQRSRAWSAAIAGLGLGLIAGALPHMFAYFPLSLAFALLVLASAALPLAAVARAERRALLVPLALFACLAPASAEAARVATEAVVHAPAGAVGAGLGAAVVLFAALAIEGARLLPRLSTERLRVVVVAVAGVVSVVAAGRAASALQVLGLAPATVLGWVGTPALGIHPTIESCAAQLLVAALALAALRGPRNESKIPGR